MKDKTRYACENVPHIAAFVDGVLAFNGASEEGFCAIRSKELATKKIKFYPADGLGNLEDVTEQEFRIVQFSLNCIVWL